MSTNDPLGFDVYVGPEDLDPTGRSASGLELVEAAIVHRLTADKIDMIDAPNGVIDFGINVRRWIGEAMTPGDAVAKGPLIDEVLHRDPRIAKTNVTVSLANGAAFDDGGKVDLTIAIVATTVTGDVIDRIVGVSAATVEFLSQGK